MKLDWKKLSAAPAPLFPWADVRAAYDGMDPQVMRHSIDFAQEELGADARPCPDCGRAPGALTWVSIGSSDEAWSAGDERCGWLTLCPACATQVQFLLDAEMTELRREGNW